MWLYKSYKPDNFEINQKDTVVDIGAQIGVFSIFAAYYTKKGRIFSFEPVPENFKLLKNNISLNNVKNVFPINKAISDKKGKENIFLNETNTGGHSFFQNDASQSKIEVSTISLNDFIKMYNIKKIDFLKIDCEGAEYKILFACSKETLSLIKKISMEYHNIKGKKNVKTLKKFLEKNGFKVIIMPDTYPMLYAYK